ncbi:MAG: hypothetical protein ACTSO2_15520, partial [Promethearchaeota archaeon]
MKNLDEFSPELYNFVSKIVDDRIKDIKVTREEFNKLRETVQELVEAQKRTDKSIQELTEAQKTTDKSIQELAEAQKRTEETLNKLLISHKELEQQVGHLAQNYGFGLEDIGKVILPPLLEKYYNIVLKGDLERRIMKIDKEEIEIDFYGEGSE